MSGGWAGSDRRSRLPDDWPKRRLRILRRDSYRCQHRDSPSSPPCDAPANQVDHIERGDDHRLDNLQALCRRHHALKSSREGNDAKPKRVNPRESFAWAV